jgi:ketosteroid isomerase-like protein
MSIRPLLLLTISCALVIVPGAVYGEDSANASPRAATASDKASEQELIKLRKQIAEAELKGDAATLDRLYADEYTHLHSDGRLDSKAEYLKRFTSGSRKYQLNEVQDIQVRLYGSTAVIFSRGHTKSTNDGSPRDVMNQFMEVWVKKQGQWRVVAWVTTGTPQNSATSAPPR